jgi:hypothetical protein
MDLRTIGFIALTIIITVAAACSFATALEVASANKGGRRHLELRYSGRTVIAIVLAVSMILLSWMSNIKVLGMIVAIVLAVGLVAANVFLRRNGIKASFALALVWIGNLIASLRYAKVMSNNPWDVAYIIVQVVCLVLILAASAIASINTILRAFKKENEDADELEEDVRRVTADDTDEEEGTINDDDGSEEEDEDEESSDRDVWDSIIKVLAIALIIVTAFVLEAKFDFLPPYNF